jgi:hypothetical protein
MKIGDKVLFLDSYNDGTRQTGKIGILIDIRHHSHPFFMKYPYQVEFTNGDKFYGIAVPLTPLLKALL